MSDSIGTLQGHEIHGDVDVPGSWWCSCGATTKAPCGKMLAVFQASRGGHVLSRMRLTWYGLEQSTRCKCSKGPLLVPEKSRPDYVPPPAPPRKKWSRNAPCFCGAPHKFKKCHLLPAELRPEDARPVRETEGLKRLQKQYAREQRLDTLLDEIRRKEERRAEQARKRRAAKKLVQSPGMATLKKLLEE